MNQEKEGKRNAKIKIEMLSVLCPFAIYFVFK